MAYDYRAREQARLRSRSVRKRAVRPRTLRAIHVTQQERKIMRLAVIGADLELSRPRTRGDCVEGIRPCPFIGCKFHLYSDVHPVTGNLKLNFPDLEPSDLAESCALDVAERGGESLERVAELINVTRERVRQIEVVAKDKMRSASLEATLQAHTEVREALELEHEPVARASQGLAESADAGLDAFADLLLTQTPPGDREP
jgi:hypothetical protein